MNCLETAFSNGVHNLYNHALFAYVYGLADKQERYQYFLEKLDERATKKGECNMAMVQTIKLMEWPMAWCKLFSRTYFSLMLFPSHFVSEFISMNFSLCLLASLRIELWTDVLRIVK